MEAISRWHQKKTPLLEADKEFKLPPQTASSAAQNRRGGGCARSRCRRQGVTTPTLSLQPWLCAMIYVLYFIVLLICIYTARHYWFTLNRLFGFQRHPYIDIDTADWPPVTVLVAAHNEEKVIANILSA